ncbi:cyclase protein [Rutstroemia sp. NJR-2017a BBW]|nr:cyclase protein [Rutstroemia sp. NJR-2017a BBW]
MSSTPSRTPPFSSLPLSPSGPRGNAWGLYSSKSSTTSSSEPDQLGTLNRLTPQTTLAASKEIKYGIRISTDLPLNQPLTPCFGRQKFSHRIVCKSPRTVNDDVVEVNTQSSTQWDGFRHFGYQDHKVFYNGCTQDEIHNSTRNGIDVWVENGGIVGRGVLLDYAAWAETQGRTPTPLEDTKIPLSDILAVAESQNVTFHPSDILFIRSGYTKALRQLSPEESNAYATKPAMQGIGVEAGEEMLKWIWEKEFAAVAGDMLAFESLPFASQTHWLHEWLLAGWGMPIGELFDLERLSEVCREKGKWEFFFSSVPLKVPGGVASPPNGVAIL